jgi:hypothetical protein
MLRFVVAEALVCIAGPFVHTLDDAQQIVERASTAHQAQARGRAPRRLMPHSSVRVDQPLDPDCPAIAQRHLRILEHSDCREDGWIDSACPGGCAGDDCRFVVCTGGEPLLQLDESLIEALHNRGFQIAVETNGTQPLPRGLDWVCVSPKAEAPLAVAGGDELKLVYPQATAMPERFLGLDFRHWLLQPMDGRDREAATSAAIAYCLGHPQWRLSVQTHKIIGVR